jgi:dTDP-4-dehydrorhamnose 3,5-epimerase
MSFFVESTHLNGVVVLRTDTYKDDRGFFLEAYRSDNFEQLGIPDRFVQDNHSGSKRGVVRGLHFQYDPPMGKLMRVTVGSAFMVAVDIRKDSPTLGQWFGLQASAENALQVWAPAGFARGFCATSDWTEVQYKCTAIYNPATESGILWSDPEIGIEWPLSDPLLSDKDAKAQRLREWLERPEAGNFRY